MKDNHDKKNAYRDMFREDKGIANGASNVAQLLSDNNTEYITWLELRCSKVENDNAELKRIIREVNRIAESAKEDIKNKVSSGTVACRLKNTLLSFVNLSNKAKKDGGKWL